MTDSRTVEFETRLTPEEVFRVVSRSITTPTVTERTIPTRVRLAGDLSPPAIRLYRDRGGRDWYVAFRGTVCKVGDVTLLKGRFTKKFPMTAGFMIYGHTVKSRVLKTPP